MNQKQINHLNMYEGVLAHFDLNTLLWQSKSPLVKSINVLRAIILILRGSVTIQQENTTSGYTAKKNAALDKILIATLQVVLQVKNYAADIEDWVLHAIVDFTESSLCAGPEKEVISRCGLIVKKAKEHIADLTAGGYEVNDADLTILLADIEAEKKLSAERDVVGATRSGTTANVPKVIVKATAELKKLDDLVKSMIKDEAFVSTYTVLRFLNNRRGGHGGGDEPEIPAAE